MEHAGEERARTSGLGDTGHVEEVVCRLDLVEEGRRHLGVEDTSRQEEEEVSSTPRTDYRRSSTSVGCSFAHHHCWCSPKDGRG